MPKRLNKVPDQLRITAQESGGVAFEAAEDDGENKVRKFTMTAYTGGLLQLSNFFYPVVVDLQASQSEPGTELTGQKKLL